MTYSDIYQLATANTTFANQVQMAIVKAAVSISANVGSGKSAVDQKRNSLAVAILNNPLGHLLRFVFACSTAANFKETADDTQVDEVVATVFNGIAGVTFQDINS